jgi:outer membrane beta-barrel protein
MRFLQIFSARFIFLTLALPFGLQAQTDELADSTSDIEQIEAEVESKVKKDSYQEVVPEKELTVEDFSGLGRLAPFSEVSVLQKRFLPKTGRFQFFGGVTNVINDPWFFGIGLNAKVGYHLTEAWSVEATGLFLSNSSRDSTKNLFSEHGVAADSIVTPKSFVGGSIVWTPIYGKISYGNRRIIPFDMYFSAGAGSTAVDGGSAGSTVSLSTGQIYAFTKSYGFRWDFTWNNYSATPKGGGSQGFNNLLLTAGMSFFFPEAKYR